MFIWQTQTCLLIPFLVLHVAWSSGLSADDPSGKYGNQISQLPLDLAEKLAQANTPDASGAMGRNKRAYFHPRFQRGMHHVADFALVTKRLDVLDRFFKAAEYAFAHQLESGDFKLAIPAEFKQRTPPGAGELASGVAFFASSLGLGVYALETNDWFSKSAECAAFRIRLENIKIKLPAMLDYLKRSREALEATDRRAPNRLLFDALAFATLGKILDDKKAHAIAVAFVDKAIQQIDPIEGCFIEGGGYDSSYNAVATALLFRMVMLAVDDATQLKEMGRKSIGWQKKRVLENGEVSTKGNARVRPGQSGESFLGKEKGVDVGHVVEAFMLASQILADQKSVEVARKIVAYYERKTR